MCMSYCHHPGCSARLHGAAHQRQRSEMRWLLTNTTLSSTPLSNPQGPQGYGYCHLWVKASPFVWCLNIRLFDMLLLFQVCLTGQDCEQISHKDLNSSAERQTSLSSLIKAELSSLPSLCLTSLQMRFILNWRLLVDVVKNYKEGWICFSVSSDCFCFFSSSESAVTMVLFLVGISIAVNNSSHENQTAGNLYNYNYSIWLYNFLERKYHICIQIKK